MVSTQRTLIGGSPSANEASGHGDPDSPAFTRQYSYEELDQEPRPAYSPTSHGFKYGQEGQDRTGRGQDGQSPGGQHEVKRAKAQAFNYAPGELGSGGVSPPASGKDTSADGAMPETSVDDATTTSGMDTSTEAAVAAAGGKKAKKNKKDKDKKKKSSDKKDKKDKFAEGKTEKLSKEEKALQKAQKKDEKKRKKEEEKNKKKKKSKFGIFGGRRKKEEVVSSSSESSSESSSSGSESDDSVIKETQEGAQPGDLDASLAASERLLQESGILSQADVSNRSYSVGDQTFTGDTNGTSPPGVAGPKVIRTTTKKTTVAQGGELSESIVETREDSATGQFEVNTSHQTKVRPRPQLLIIFCVCVCRL